MLVTTGAQIGFWIMMLFWLAMFSATVKILNPAGIVCSILLSIFNGYLLYYQAFDTFFVYALFSAVFTPFVPILMYKDSARVNLNLSKYILTVAMSLFLNFGEYGILHLLNKP